MANKQPFYHRAVVLFTATEDVSKEEFEAALKQLKIKNVIKTSFEVEDINAEPGDPADLM